jgi:AcrR family transcriptional regulator
VPGRRSPGQRAGLSRERVLDAALAIADRDGLAALTMRRLGSELGVEAMTLYHHLPNKDALLDGLVERVLELAAPPETDGRAWTDSMRDYAIALRATLRQHPGVLPLAATRPAVTPQTLRTVERSLELLHSAGFSLGLALDLVNTLSVFVIGHVAAEEAIPAATEADSIAQLAELDPAEFPLLSAAARDGQGTDDESRFRTAVEAFLLGFGALRDQATASKATLS